MPRRCRSPARRWATCSRRRTGQPGSIAIRRGASPGGRGLAGPRASVTVRDRPQHELAGRRRRGRSAAPPSRRAPPGGWIGRCSITASCRPPRCEAARGRERRPARESRHPRLYFHWRRRGGGRRGTRAGPRAPRRPPRSRRAHRRLVHRPARPRARRAPSAKGALTLATQCATTAAASWPRPSRAFWMSDIMPSTRRGSREDVELGRERLGVAVEVEQLLRDEDELVGHPHAGAAWRCAGCRARNRRSSPRRTRASGAARYVSPRSVTKPSMSRFSGAPPISTITWASSLDSCPTRTRSCNPVTR